MSNKEISKEFEDSLCEAFDVTKVFMDKKKILAFIDEYCQLVLKHKMQFSFGFTDLSEEHPFIFYELAIEEYMGGLVIGQTYPNKELAKAVGGLNARI